MTATLTLFVAELRMLGRDATAWTTAIVLPLLLGGLWSISSPPIGDGWSAVIALQLVLLLMFTLHTVGTMTLASRRQQLVLKRWRSSQASPTAILAGTIAVPSVLVVVQSVLLTVVTMTVAVESPRPASWPLLAVAILTATATVGALTFVAAAFTRSSEHAMITTFPLMVVLMGGTAWALLADPTSVLGNAAMLVPGVASTELVVLAWDGVGEGGAMELLRAARQPVLASIGLVGLATWAAVRTFRFAPRR